MNPTANQCPLPKFAFWGVAAGLDRPISRPLSFPPPQPLFPHSGSAIGILNGLHPKSKFLAVGQLDKHEIS